MAPVSESDFSSTDRFEVRRRLGAGAFGVVYAAFDRERETVVALKTLRNATVEALYRLKHEFRSLADTTHRNLVALHELLAEDEQWFFTMELVEGGSFLDYVRGGVQLVKDPGSPETQEPATSQTREPATGTETFTQVGGLSVGLGGTRGGTAWVGFPNVARLRETLRQAVLGLSALHEAGKLHRDIKPSNVLVTNEGRLVLLDFGLVTELGPRELEGSLAFAGTPAYMSPEQGVGVSEASDWYSLGVMLFEALTGRRPFEGTLRELLWSKLHADPPSPRQLAPDVPGDLNDLCRDLLRRDPMERPTGREILSRLGGVQAAIYDARTIPLPLVPRAAPFVGRETHLSALADALTEASSGRTVAIYVEGRSGLGKTALVRRFLDGLQGDDVVVLRGRCYEQESVPFKALDSLIDGLSQYLKKLPVESVEALLPADILALARVFPVLRRVEAATSARRRAVEIADAFELRRRAFAALRDLLSRMAARQALVLFIDDLQWGDADSANFLIELMRPPDAPPLLFIGAYRSDEAATSSMLQKLLGAETAKERAPDVRHLPVGELSKAEAQQLASTLLAENGPASLAEAAAIAGESGGSPFFIDELVRFGQAGVARPRGARTTLDEIVRERVQLLPEEPQRLLEVVAVAGQPLELGVAREAADQAGPQAAEQLRVAHLVRLRASAGGDDEIETYHDRIREAVLAHVSPQALQDHHRRLARALLASGRADPEQLALHYQEAGDGERAAEHAVSAADRAAEALAFDRAARFYRTALELGFARDATVRRSLNTKMGDALANAGRGRDAATAYLAAAEGASQADTLNLERRAAGQLMQSGHIDEALPIFKRMTGRIGLDLFKFSRRAEFLVNLAQWFRRVRGYRFRERDASQIAPERLIRWDIYWTVLSGLALLSARQGAPFHQRALTLALRCGEPNRIAKSLAFEIAMTSNRRQTRNLRRTETVFKMALDLSERTGNEYAVGLSWLYASCAALFQGRWSTSLERGRKAEAILRERCTGVAWEILLSRSLWLRSLFYLGGLKEIASAVPAFIREARQRDDLLAIAGLGVRHLHVVHLAADDAEGARQNLRLLVGRFTRKGFLSQHLWALIAGAEIELFDGHTEAAWQLVTDQWEAFRHSGLRYILLWRIEALHLRTRSALATAVVEGMTLEGKRLLRSADRDARRMERTGEAWGKALAQLVRAGISAARGRCTEALNLLEAAENHLTRLDMALYAAAAKRRRGQLLGGDEGAALVATADAWMTGQEIKNPARMADMLAPGRWS